MALGRTLRGGGRGGGGIVRRDSIVFGEIARNGADQHLFVRRTAFDAGGLRGTVADAANGDVLHSAVGRH